MVEPQGAFAERPLERALVGFEARLGGAPDLVSFAPGRINLIGEHTDYNHGLVLPMAIDRGVYVAARRRKDRKLCVHSVDLDSSREWDLDALALQAEAGWANYPASVYWALAQDGLAGEGADLVVAGDLPQAAGLSSSAALELAVAAAAGALAGRDWEPVRMALLAHRAENEFIGVHCGVLDQFACAVGTPKSALFLDCRSLEFRSIPLRFDDCEFVVADTGVKRELRTSRYNQRRDECRLAVDKFRLLDPTVESLRDVDSALLAKAAERVDAVGDWMRRVRHVVSENGRVLQGVVALERGDAPEFGALMNESHLSLRKDFEVSCRELDLMASLAQELPGCHGSRMVGAGFGGCTLSLVKRDAVPAFRASLSDAYQSHIGRPAPTFVFQPGRLAGVV